MSKSYWPLTQCRVCGNPHLVSLINLDHLYLTGVFPREKERKLTQGPLELVKCMPAAGESVCGLVQLRHSYHLNELYGNAYGYRSALNRSMVEHLHQISRKICRSVSLNRGDVVIDVGSNDGTLLGAYPDKELELIGIDPSAEKFRKYYPARASLLTDFFPSPKLTSLLKDRKAKVITSIAMFYDLENPLGFARAISDMLDKNGIWFSEQSYLPSMLKTVSYDTICHEHLEYYAIRQIKWIADRAGFYITDLEINDVNGGSFCFVLAKKDSDVFRENRGIIKMFSENEKKERIDQLDAWENFHAAVINHKERLLRMLRDLKNSGKKVLGYGASTKGNVILQYCNITPELLPYIAEVNEEKFGTFTPGTGIPIISEKEAKQMKPDYFLVLPWHFKKNIIAREKPFIEEGGKLIFPLPEIHVVDKGNVHA